MYTYKLFVCNCLYVTFCAPSASVNLFRQTIFFVHQSKMFPIDKAFFVYLGKNRDILCAYFSLGFLLQLPVTVMRFFLVDRLKLGRAMLAQSAAVVAFPWAVKMGTGFLSDNFLSKWIPRNRQIAIAYGLAGLCWFAFLFLPPSSTDSLFLVLFYGFLSSFFMSLADVCQDGLMVRRINADSSNANGRLPEPLALLLGVSFPVALRFFFSPFCLLGFFTLLVLLVGLAFPSPVGNKGIAEPTSIKILAAGSVWSFAKHLYLVNVYCL